jgi:hypothetical protein
MTLSIPIREPSDFRFTVRQSSWDGGYNRLYYQVINALTEPRFWDSFNVTTEVEGEIGLAYLFERVQTDATDKKPILATFNGKVYRLEGVATPAVQSTADGTTWSTISMASGPTTAIKNYGVWKNSLFVAAGVNSIYKLTSGDVWSAITPPTGIVAVADAISVAPDGKLLAWYNGKGLYQTAIDPPAAADWSKVWPAGTVDPDEATCDVLDGSTGTVIICTSDNSKSSIHEYFTPEGAATAGSVVTWMQERDTFFYIARMYKNAAYIGGKKGIGGGQATVGQGLLYRKERGMMPILVQEIGDGIRGAVASRDFGVRALVSVGQFMWVGASSRAVNFSSVVGVPGCYRYEVTVQGVENIAPDSMIDTSPGNVAGSVYSAEQIGGQVLIATPTGTWKRSLTNRAAQGYLDTSIYDLRSPDHVKTWRFTEVLVEDASPTEAIAIYYRTGTIVGSWLGGTTVTAAGAKKISFPDDSRATNKYKLNSRQIQTHIVLSRGADATKQPRVTSLAVDAAQIRPVGADE